MTTIRTTETFRSAPVDRALLWLLEGVGRVVAVTRLAYRSVRLAALAVVGLALYVVVFGGLIFSFLGAAGMMAEGIVNLFLPRSLEMDGPLIIGFPLLFIAYSIWAPISRSTIAEIIRERGWRPAVQIGVIPHLARWLEPWREAIAQRSLDRAAAYAVNRAGRAIRHADLGKLDGERRDYEQDRLTAVQAAMSSRDTAVSVTTDFSIEPFRGWRTWRLAPSANGPVLTGVVHQVPWEQAEVTATCGVEPLDPEGHRSPVPYCTCGIYAFKDPHPERWTDRAVSVTGSVILWGRVVEAERGFRAERARIAVPLTLHGNCAGFVGKRGCSRQARLLFDEAGAYRPACRAHARRWLSAGTKARPVSLKDVCSQLRKRYGVPVQTRGELWTLAELRRSGR